MIVMLSRKDTLGQAFEAASERGTGLTAVEMNRVVGGNWRRWLEELETDGWVFREEPSRFGRPSGTFRWVLLYAPPAADQELPPAEPEQLALLDDAVGVRPANPLGVL